MRTYIVVYLLSLLLAVFLMPIIIYLARKFSLVDAGGIRNVHDKPTPRIGGIAIALPSLALIMAVLALNNSIGIIFRSSLSLIVTLLISGFVMFSTGIVDDIRGLRARVKLLVQLLAAGAICCFGARVESVTVVNYTIEFGIFSWPITVLYIVGITNAVNLIDGLDGLAGGIGAIACGVIAVIASFHNDIMMTVIMLAMLGSLTGFLLFNFNPARIFMGDCGSLFLGFMIAGSSVICAQKSTTVVGLGLPVLALGIPIFDTFFSMLRRLLERRGMFAPDRGHIHHRLLDKGLHQRHVVIFLYVVTLVMVGFGMFMMLTRDYRTVILFASLLVLLVLVFRMAGSVRLRETLAGLKSNVDHASEMNLYKGFCENSQLHLREVNSATGWWKIICDVAEKMDYVSLVLETRHGYGDKQEIATWENPILSKELEDVNVKTIHSVIPVHYRNEKESKFQLRIVIKIKRSLELAGHRVTLMTRLLDEYGMCSEGVDDLHDLQSPKNTSTIVDINGGASKLNAIKKPGG